MKITKYDTALNADTKTATPVFVDETQSASARHAALLDEVAKISRLAAGRMGSGRALARELGVTSACVSHWVNGRKAPRRKMWKRLIEIAEGAA